MTVPKSYKCALVCIQAASLPVCCEAIELDSNCKLLNSSARSLPKPYSLTFSLVSSFGDTVNTASVRAIAGVEYDSYDFYYITSDDLFHISVIQRMESNGQGNAIQCSQATADLIIAAQKGHWLTKRKDLVEAKGKGSMQTYWIEPYGNAPSVSEAPSDMSTFHTSTQGTPSLLGPPHSSEDMRRHASSLSPRGSLSMIYPNGLR